MTKEEFKNLLKDEIYSNCIYHEDMIRARDSLQLSSYQLEDEKNAEEDFSIDIQSISDSILRTERETEILFNIFSNVDDYRYEIFDKDKYKELGFEYFLDSGFKK